MKITCPRSVLLAAISAVSPAIPSKTPSDILKNICLTVTDAGAVLMATDQEIGIRYEMKDVTSTKNGTVILPPGRLGQILREISDETVEMEVKGTKINIVAGSSKFNLQTAEADTFPAPKGFTEKAYHVVKSGAFRRAIDRVAYCADTESNRYALGGICVDLGVNGEVKLIATDSRRLSIARIARTASGNAFSPEFTSLVVPVKALKMIASALPEGEVDVFIAIMPSEIAIKSEGVIVTSRLIEGRFPRYMDVIPSDFNVTVSAVVGPLLSATRQAMIVTNEESKGVDFNFADSNLTLKSIGAEVGDSEIVIPLAIDGGELSTTFDPKFLSQFLKTLADTDQVIGKFVDGDSAVLWTCGDDYQYVIMPLARD